MCELSSFGFVFRAGPFAACLRSAITYANPKSRSKLHVKWYRRFPAYQEAVCSSITEAIKRECIVVSLSMAFFHISGTPGRSLAPAGQF